MAVIGYTRVSTDKQDLEKQKHLLLEYAQAKELSTNGPHTKLLMAIYSYFVQHDEQLLTAWKSQRGEATQGTSAANQLYDGGKHD